MKSQNISIDPITRIEGHGKITIHLDEEGSVQDARFHITQFRGFEKFCEGRPFYEMPSITARICGICPVSHLLTSAKACDEILSVRIPETAVKLRSILHLAQFIQSHALSFFYLSSPDLLLGMDANPAKRNIIGVLQSHPELAKDGLFLRKFGQQIIQWLGQERVHSSWVVPGGVNLPLSSEHRDKILAMIPEALAVIQRTLKWFKPSLEKYQNEIESFANFDTLFMGLVTEDGGLKFYDGNIRIVNSEGKIVEKNLDPLKYQDFIGEAVEPWSYMKFPYYKPMGYPNGIYRVGPLARLNVINHFRTKRAEKEFKEYRQMGKKIVLSSFHNHYARLLEILYSIERVEEILNEPDILSKHIRAFASPNSYEGIGVTEAPRGVLIHHYKIDENGLITYVNLIVATGHNNLAMNKGILQVAKRFVNGNKFQEGMLNRVEAVIRTFDPCLSCASHAVGQMPLSIQLMDIDGKIVNKVETV